MALITRSAHSPNVSPSDVFCVLWIDPLRQLGAGLPASSRARASVTSRAEPKTDFSWLAVPAIQEHPPPATVRRNREIEAAAVGMAAVLRDRRYRPSVQPVDFPCHRLFLP